MSPSQMLYDTFTAWRLADYNQERGQACAVTTLVEWVVAREDIDSLPSNYEVGRDANRLSAPTRLTTDQYAISQVSSDLIRRRALFPALPRVQKQPEPLLLIQYTFDVLNVLGNRQRVAS